MVRSTHINTLIADSGSTKTDWLLSTHAQTVKFSTSGYNPYIMGMPGLIEKISAELIPHIRGLVIDRIRFYGSGFSTEGYVNTLETWFQEKTGAQDVEVAHDLLGTARACCGHEPGITAILGTGSNSCLFDGTHITRNLGGHGYLFGDEGSGADMGKILVKAMLELTLPTQTIQDILKDTGFATTLDLRNSIYGATQINTALASVSKVLLPRIHQPEIESLVRTSFDAFIQKTLLKYPESAFLPVHFTGSIAQYYQDILISELKKHQIQPGRCIGRPLDALALYHA
jgi:glucosamine kinase